MGAMGQENQIYLIFVSPMKSEDFKRQGDAGCENISISITRQDNVVGLFLQGDIYLVWRMWSNIWDFAKLVGSSLIFRGINPKYLTTAILVGISFEISL